MSNKDRRKQAREGFSPFGALDRPPSQAAPPSALRAPQGNALRILALLLFFYVCGLALGALLWR